MLLKKQLTNVSEDAIILGERIATMEEMDDDELLAMLNDEEPTQEPLTAADQAFLRGQVQSQSQPSNSKSQHENAVGGSQGARGSQANLEDDELQWLLYGDSEPQGDEPVARDGSRSQAAAPSQAAEDPPVHELDDEELMYMMEGEAGTQPGACCVRTWDNVRKPLLKWST